jgi:hypothetical protein
MGLYDEAVGDKARALEQIAAAAGDRFGGGHMHSVAKLHLAMLQRPPR